MKRQVNLWRHKVGFGQEIWEKIDSENGAKVSSGHRKS